MYVYKRRQREKKNENTGYDTPKPADFRQDPAPPRTEQAETKAKHPTQQQSQVNNRNWRVTISE